MILSSWLYCDNKGLPGGRSQNEHLPDTQTGRWLAKNKRAAAATLFSERDSFLPEFPGSAARTLASSGAKSLGITRPCPAAMFLCAVSSSNDRLLPRLSHDEVCSVC